MSRYDRDFEPAAGNSLMDRWFFLKTGTASGALLMTASASAQERPPWMRLPGAALGIRQINALLHHAHHHWRADSQGSAS